MYSQVQTYFCPTLYICWSILNKFILNVRTVAKATHTNYEKSHLLRQRHMTKNTYKILMTV